MAIDADRAFGHKRGDDWLWSEGKVEEILNDNSDDPVFICGSASNRDRYMPRFSKVFILVADDETLERRLLHRTNNDFGKDTAVLARQIARNQGVKEYSIKRGRIVIDATSPIAEVVDDILDQLSLS